MSSSYSKIKKELEKTKQMHLLNFYDELNDNEQKQLLNNVTKLDIKKINKLYINSYIDEEENIDLVEPLPYYEYEDLSDEELKEYTLLGETAVKNNEIAVITMAGGMGSRLGHSGPKGTFELNINYNKISIFEIFINQLKEAYEKYNIYVTWYIMTSTSNYEITKKFFEENNYFNYPKDKIKFFNQHNLPILNTEGKILLKTKKEPLLGPNGNGDVFDSFNKSGYLSEAKQNNIKWIFTSGIDNILVKLIDPLFVGLTISKNYEVASKTIFKEDPMSKDCVFCKKNNSPSILQYQDITKELSNLKKNSKYLYRDINIVSHLISIPLIEKVCKENFPYHRAYKRNSYIDMDGNKVVPEGRNSFKFEKFIFDAFSYVNDMLLYRVKKDEGFAPIKNLTGENSVETAIKQYLNSKK